LRSGLIQVLWITMRGARTAAERRFQLFRIPAQQRPKCRNGGIGRHAFARAMIAFDRARNSRTSGQNRRPRSDVASGFRGHAAGHPAAIHQDDAAYALRIQPGRFGARRG